LFVHQFYQTPAGACVWIDALALSSVAKTGGKLVLLIGFPASIPSRYLP